MENEIFEKEKTREWKMTRLIEGYKMGDWIN